MPDQDQTLSDEEKNSYQFLMKAVRDGQVALISCAGELDPSKRYAVICAVCIRINPENNETEISFTPLARMLSSTETEWIRPAIDSELNQTPEMLLSICTCCGQPGGVCPRCANTHSSSISDAHGPCCERCREKEEER